MKSDRLNEAINKLQEGKKDQARSLIIAEVREDPSNLHAWLWALEVARNEKEKRTILQRILAIDPDHRGALQYLRKLDGGEDDTPPRMPAPLPDSIRKTGGESDQQVSRLGGLLRLIADWLLSLPASCGFLALFMIGLIGLLIYFRVNTSFFGLAGTNFDDLVISNSYQLISTDEMYWEVQFEGIGESKYIGAVRHAAPIRMKGFPILSHDILVTTADFADPEIVDTNVLDHKFFWKSPGVSSPNGTINLIHAVPANQQIYEVLLSIEKWDTVKITGREIYNIKAFQPDGTLIGTWQDMGCNTLLVETVSVIKGDPEN